MKNLVQDLWHCQFPGAGLFAKRVGDLLLREQNAAMRLEDAKQMRESQDARQDESKEYREEDDDGEEAQDRRLLGPENSQEERESRKLHVLYLLIDLNPQREQKGKESKGPEREKGILTKQVKGSACPFILSAMV